MSATNTQQSSTFLRLTSKGYDSKTHYPCGCPRDYDDIRALACLSTKRWIIADKARHCGHGATIVYEYLTNDSDEYFDSFSRGDFTFAKSVLTSRQYAEFLKIVADDEAGNNDTASEAE